MRRLLTLVLLVAIGFGAGLPWSGAVAAQPVGGEAAAEAAAEVAVELSVLEAEGEFDLLYDLIHPDARAEVPRGAVVGWYENDFAPLGPSEITVTGVEFVEWTWAVTGETYADTAEVSYLQPFSVEGTTVESTVHLVEFDGEWRWFFGRSREFVDEQIARYVPAEPVTLDATEESAELALIEEDLDSFWSGIAAQNGLIYEAPEVVLVEEAVSSACGRAEDQFGAFYCTGDGTIYLEDEFSVFLYDRGDFALALVVAHEWAHHVQAQNGGFLVTATGGDAANTGDPTLYTIEIELQADCLAGVWAQDAEVRGWLETGDVEEAVSLSLEVGGDLPGTSVYDLYAHGSGEQRADAFLAGYYDGFAGCDFAL
jgi:predicted metalloprotease